MPLTSEDILGALRQVIDPDLHRDLVTLGMIEGLEVEGGVVSFTLVLTTSACPLKEQIEADVRAKVMAVPGVRELKLTTTSKVRKPRDPSADRKALAGVAQVIAIGSGKGGVGKSTVSANLAVALARAGHRVGLMDADIYGPNIPRMLGVDQKPEVVGGKIQPLESHGVKLMSLGFIVEREAPAIWRGPIIMKIIQQFVRDVAWGDLDYFIVDLPPGTGDAQLSLVQTIHLHGAVIVTTPQEVAVGDSLRGAKMFEKVGVRVLGIVENMSYYICPHCGDRSELFLSGGGERLAGELGIPLLGQIPLQARVPQLADAGQPVVAAEPGSPAAEALAGIATRVAEALAAAPAH